MKEKIDKIMEPAKHAMDHIDYNEGIVIGSAFGQLIAIIEEQRETIQQLECEIKSIKKKNFTKV